MQQLSEVLVQNYIGIGISCLQPHVKTRSNSHPAWFNPSHAELYATRAGLDILVLVSSGAQRAVRGIAPMPLSDRPSWAELWEGDRQRDRRGRQKSGHLERQAAGSHGGVTDRMVLSCSVSVLSASKSYETTLKRLGMGIDWVLSRIIQTV